MTSKEMEIDSPSGGCVLKVKVRKSFSQLAEYCAAHSTNMNGEAMREAIFTNMATKTPTPRELSREVGFCFRQRQNKKVNTGHLIISPSVPFRDEKDLEQAVSIALKVHGLQETPWAAFYHGEKREKHPHSHIAFSLIRWDGSAVNMDHSYRKNEQAARAIEAAFPYLGKLSVRPKSERPTNNDPAHTAMRRERRILKRKDIENGRRQRYFEHAPDEDESHRGKPEKLSENRLHALSERRVAHHGIPESQGVLQADAFTGGREPDRVRWQSGNSTELISTNSKNGSTDNMTAQAKIKDLETQVRAALARDDVIDLASFREAVREETGADVEFWRGPSGDVAGWSLVLEGGTKLKGSEISRSLSFARVAAALSERDRRRRMVVPQAEAAADAIQDTAQVLAASTNGAGAVIALGLSAQPRAVVKPTRPAPGAKPHLFVVKPQGAEIPGYLATRGECLDPERDVHLWEYRKAGSDEIVFSDDGESLQIHGESLADPLAVDAFVLAARARFGASLTLTQVPAEPPHFLAMLQASAAERGVEIIDARTGLPIGAQQAHKEPTPAPEGMQSLGFLDFKQDPAPRSAPVAARPGQGEAPAAPAPAQPQPLAPDRSDLAARRRAAGEVRALVTREVRAEGPALGTLPRDASKVSSLVLRAQLERAQAFLPAQTWAEQVAAWHRAEHETFGDRGLSPQESVLREAEISGDRLAAAACKAAQDRAHAEACLFLTRQERDARSTVLRGAELLSGKAREREADISRLEAVEKDAKAAELLARREFFAQQEVRQRVGETAELRETHLAELSALDGVAGLLRILATLVRKLTAMVTEAVRRETEQERDRTRDAELREHLERLAAGEPEAVARQRRELEELEKQHQGQQESIVVDRERGR